MLSFTDIALFFPGEKKKNIQNITRLHHHTLQLRYIEIKGRDRVDNMI